MTDSLPPSNDSNSTILFLLVRFTPILITLIFGISNSSFFFSSLLFLLFAFLDFYLTKTYFGLNLVGLHWFFDRSQSPNFPFIVFFALPSPFVAKTFNSNIFWIGLVFSAFFDFLLSVIFAVASRFRWTILFGILFLLTIFHIVAFVKCHAIVKNTEDEAVKTLLFGRNVPFQEVTEKRESDSQKLDELQINEIKEINNNEIE
jgi:ABC-type uncharacterized transport system permease subunit